jgi:hypothetical protein
VCIQRVGIWLFLSAERCDVTLTSNRFIKRATLYPLARRRARYVVSVPTSAELRLLVSSACLRIRDQNSFSLLLPCNGGNGVSMRAECVSETNSNFHDPTSQFHHHARWRSTQLYERSSHRVGEGVSLRRLKISLDSIPFGVQKMKTSQAMHCCLLISHLLLHEYLFVWILEAAAYAYRDHAQLQLIGKHFETGKWIAGESFNVQYSSYWRWRAGNTF